MMKNRQLLIAIAVLLVVAAAGCIYLLSAGTPAKTTSSTPGIADESVPSIDPSELGLTLSARSDNRAVKFVMTKAKDVTGVDYELSYTAAGNIPRGAIGHVEAVGEKVESPYIDLGTCSSGKCKYDEGVEHVKLVLKISKSNGKSYQSETTLDL